MIRRSTSTGESAPAGATTRICDSTGATWPDQPQPVSRKPVTEARLLRDYCRSITFDYVVQEGDADVEGVSVAADALTSRGGWIRDRYGNDAKLGLVGGTLRRS